MGQPSRTMSKGQNKNSTSIASDRKEEAENEDGKDVSSSERLEDKMQTQHLHLLRREFLRYDEERDNNNITDHLSEKDFTAAIDRVMKTDTYKNEARRIFHDICVAGDQDRQLNWLTFLNHLIKNSYCTQEGEFMHSTFFDGHYCVRLLTHNRRAPTAKIIGIAASNFVYVFISKTGVVGILDQNLKLQKAYMVDVDDTQRYFGNVKNVRKRVCRAWVTDAQHMADCKKLVIGSTNRTLHFYDISAATHMEEFRVFGLPNVATCFAYWFNEQDEDSESLLFFGDDAGNIHCLRFLQPKTLLFKKLNMEDSTRIFFMELIGSREFVNYTVLEKVHSQSIVRLQYVPHNTSLISCSSDPEDPLIIRDVYGKLKSYVFKLSKGIQCFDYDRSMNLLVTGGIDCLVRFWNPYVPAQPTSILEGHDVAIIDVKLLPDRYLVITYSRDLVVKTWDIVRHQCLQTLLLRFPVSHQPRFEPEHGPFPIHLETFNQKSILVACHDYVTELKMAENKDCEEQILILPENTRKSVKAGKMLEFEKFHQANTTADRKTIQYLKEKNTVVPPRVITFQMDDLEFEALEDFDTYICAKMRDLRGHANQREMKHLVKQGLPFRALKVSQVENVVIDQELPMSERMHERGLSYSSENDLFAMNLNFAGNAPGWDGLSSRCSSVSSNWDQLSMPLSLHVQKLWLPSIQSVSSGKCSTSKDSVTHQYNI